VNLELLRVMRKAARPLTFNEINERVDRRRSAVQAAFSQLRDQGTFLETERERMRENGRKYRTTLFEIDPNGPRSAG
jgi:DNA phosphorothioation-dependent restriction protein DptG